MRDVTDGDTDEAIGLSYAEWAEARS